MAECNNTTLVEVENHTKNRVQECKDALSARRSDLEIVQALKGQMIQKQQFNLANHSR